MFDAHRYRGRHRAPSTTARTAARVAAAGVVAAAPLVAPTAAWAATGDELDIVAQCESGDRNIQNVESTASGHWQMINGTWALFGGQAFAPRAIDATRAEQRIVAERAFAANGLRDWEASRSCWGPRVGAHAATSGRHAATPQRPPTITAPATGEPRHATDGVYTVARGDTLGDIAAAHGTTASAVFKANRDTVHDPDRIFPGERLRV